MKNFLERLINAKYYSTKEEADEMIAKLMMVNLIDEAESTELFILSNEIYLDEEASN